MRRFEFVLGCGAVVLLSACSEGGRDSSALDDDSISTLTITASASASGSDGETGATTRPVSTTLEERFDLPNESGGNVSAATNSDGEQGCAKVDFVFVIDSSASMEDEQVALLASLPGFITAIEDTLMINDFHLMAVDAGATEGSGCDGELGVGQILSGDGSDCGVSGGIRYVTPEQGELSEVFTCTASRGIEGAINEQTLDALLASIGPLSQPGGCNEGFLRDDAILVITIITDEEDSPNDNRQGGPGGINGQCLPIDNDTNSNGDPDGWYDAVVALKGGNAEAAVVLALLGDCDLSDGECPGFSVMGGGPGGGTLVGAEPAPRIREFAKKFPLGSVGPICADDYAPFFEAAVSVIETACEQFQPIE